MGIFPGMDLRHEKSGLVFFGRFQEVKLEEVENFEQIDSEFRQTIIINIFENTIWYTT